MSDGIDLKAVPVNAKLVSARQDLLGAIDKISTAYELDAQQMGLVVEACLGEVNKTLLAATTAQLIHSITQMPAEG